MRTRRQSISLPEWMWETIDELRRVAPDEFGTRNQSIVHLLETSLWQIKIAVAYHRMRIPKTLHNLDNGRTRSTSRTRPQNQLRRRPPGEPD